MTERTVSPGVDQLPPVDGADSNGASTLSELLRVRHDHGDVYVGRCHAGAPNRVMGGQVAAQALAAAGRTVDADRLAHSLHGYFLREGRPDQDIEFHVRRNRDGRSYSARQVSAVQAGVEIFALTASFTRPVHGHERQLVAPVVPQPATAPDVYDVWGTLHPEAHGEAVYVDAVEVRIVPRPAGPTPPLADGSVGQDVWLRSRAPLPDDPLVHACALTYLSDVTLAQSSAIEHELMYPLRAERGRVALASIDHAVWFHRPLRADGWLHLRQTSLSVGGGRGFNRGTFWSPDGTMVASAAQESVVRLLQTNDDRNNGR